MMALDKGMPHDEAGEIELLLPWHAAGTLKLADARRVEAALCRDAGLAKRYAAICAEYEETVYLTERLGAPTPRAMQKLFAAIDGEPAGRPRASVASRSWISARRAGLCPRPPA